MSSQTERNPIPIWFMSNHTTATAPPTADPSPPPAPPMVLVDRHVRFEDELLAVVKESGQPSLDLVIESVLGRFPDSSNEEERDAAVDAEMSRYMEEVDEPAFKILRERKASRPSAVRRAPVYCANADDVAYYSELLLDGIEPCLSQLDGAPSVTSLTLRISWPPNHPVRGLGFSAYIAASDHVYLVIYFGRYDLGFYLVYDTLANYVTIIPPRLSSSFHPGTGHGLAILGIHKEPGRHPSFYVLAQLLFRLPSNKGTLCMWWSPGSSPLAKGRWMERKVVLPIPADEGTTSTRPTYSFHADMIIPVLGRSILWVDLLKGILVCDHIDRLVHDEPTILPTNLVERLVNAPVFYFIPLPDGCAIQPDFSKGRGQPEEYRSMCSITSEVFKFVSLETYSEGCPMDKVLFRTWNLILHRDTGTWRWETVLESRVDIWNDPIYKNDLKLQPLMPRFPIISNGLERSNYNDIIYVLLTDFKFEQGWTVASGSYVLGLDIRHGNIASAIRLPCDEDGKVRPLKKIFASHLNYLLSEGKSFLC